MAQVLRRNAPGTKAADFYNWPEQSFEDMDSTLAVQQYIQQMIRRDYLDIEGILSPPVGQDEGVWKYEHLRQFCMELNSLAVKLQEECTPETCSQMTATEQWIFLCAAHKTPKECSAIDYTRHTLDGAASLLNGSKYFPSRVSIKESSVSKLGSVCRRVYRIFSHAFYHHRHIFDEIENESYLCHRFTVYVIKYNLMSRDNLIVPILDDPSQEDSSKKDETKSSMTSILTAPSPDEGSEKSEELSAGDVDDSEITEDAHQEFGTMKPMKIKQNVEKNVNNSNNLEDNTWTGDITIGAGGDLQSTIIEGKDNMEVESEQTFTSEA